MATRTEIWNALHAIIAEIVEPSGILAEDIQASSLLTADLNLTSVDIIHMVISLEEQIGQDLDMEKLVIREGAHIVDLPLGELHGYICDQLGATA